LMLSKATQPRLPRALFVLLLVVTALVASGCSAAPSRGWSGPLVSDNVLYVGTIQGKILALDLANIEEGEPTPPWEPKLVAKPKGGGGFTCSGTLSSAMGIYGTPVISSGRIYIGGYSGQVLWIDTDGSSVSDPPFETDGAIVGSVIAYEDTLFVGSSDRKLYALTLDLKEKWHFETDGEIWSTPVASDGVIYVSSADHYLYAIDAESGHEIWRFEAEAAIMSTPLVADGMVYIGACDRKFYAIEAATEPERAAASLRDPDTPSDMTRDALSVFEGARNWFWTQALAYNGEIWVGCLDHRVYVLEAETLEYVTEISTGGMVYAPPVVFPTEGLVVVGSQDGKLYLIATQTKEVSAYAVDAKTGYVSKSPDKPKNRPAPILAPMSADQANGILYYHAQDGAHTLYAFELSTTEVLWSFRTDKISG
jgi:outer membrane protein assembly factor BamB